MEKKQLLDGFSFLKETLKFDSKKSEMTAAETDWLVIRGGFLRDLLECFDSLSPDNKENALKRSGESVGRNFYTYLRDHGMQKNEVAAILACILNDGGWGHTDINIDFNKKIGFVKISNNVLIREKPNNNVFCRFLEGYFKGLAEQLFETKTECVETQCSLRGSPVCVFVIKVAAKN
jgi:predicted hydrocarbon binding protein